MVISFLHSSCWTFRPSESLPDHALWLVLSSVIAIGRDSLGDGDRTDTVFSAALANVLTRPYHFYLTFLTLSDSVLTSSDTSSKNALAYNIDSVTLTMYRVDDALSSSVLSKTNLLIDRSKFFRYLPVYYDLHHYSHLTIAIQFAVVEAGGHHCS